MLWGIAGLLLVLWIAGFVLDVVGGLIHLVLVLAVLVVLYKLFAGRFRRSGI